jgi:hypothetical protein
MNFLEIGTWEKKSLAEISEPIEEKAMKIVPTSPP